jgi:hypothetical protein
MLCLYEAFLVLALLFDSGVLHVFSIFILRYESPRILGRSSMSIWLLVSLHLCTLPTFHDQFLSLAAFAHNHNTPLTQRANRPHSKHFITLPAKMFDVDCGHHSGTSLDGGYAELRSASGVVGGGNAQKTSSQVELQTFLIDSSICADIFQGGNYDGRSSQDQKCSVSYMI